MKAEDYFGGLGGLLALLAVAYTRSCPCEISGYTFTKLNQFCCSDTLATCVKCLKCEIFLCHLDVKEYFSGRFRYYYRRDSLGAGLGRKTIKTCHGWNRCPARMVG